MELNEGISSGACSFSLLSCFFFFFLIIINLPFERRIDQDDNHCHLHSTMQVQSSIQLYFNKRFMLIV